MVDPHYVRAGEPGGGAASSWKRGNLRAFQLGFKDFHGDGPVQDFVAAEEDAGHTAAGAKLPHEHEPVSEPAHGAPEASPRS